MENHDLYEVDSDKHVVGEDDMFVFHMILMTLLLGTRLVYRVQQTRLQAAKCMTDLVLFPHVTFQTFPECLLYKRLKFPAQNQQAVSGALHAGCALGVAKRE